MTIKNLINSLFALALLAGVSFGQSNTLTQTSLSTLALRADTYMTLTSVTNVAAPNINNPTVPGSMLYVQDAGSKGEFMKVISLTGLQVTVQRGVGGTIQSDHVSGAMVLVGQPTWFYAYDPQGSCVKAATLVTPWLNTNTAAQWICSPVTLTWVAGFNNDFASPVPTAAVASVAGAITPSGPLFHVTGALGITSITLPVGFAFGSFTMIPDGAFTLVSGNNIGAASTAIVGKPLTMTYDPATAKFYPGY